MKYLLNLICLLMMACSNGNDDNENDKSVIPPQGFTVTIMSYNIYGARATDPSNTADLNALAAVINQQSPDFVLLQEVDVYTNRTGKDVHQAKDLAQLTHMNWHFTKAIDRDGGAYGDAVLSKHEIIEKKNYHMSVAPTLTGENRSVCMIKVKVKDIDLYVASTHLDHLASEDSRIFQAEQLKDIVKGIDGRLVVGGDFNATPESKTISIVKQFLNTGYKSEKLYTWSVDNPNKMIDYVMYKPLDGFIQRNYMVVKNTKASDHMPVISVLEFK